MNKEERNGFYWVNVVLLTIFAILGYFIDSSIPLIFIGFTNILYFLKENLK